MKASRRIDRAACSAILSSRVSQPPQSIPSLLPRSQSPPARCVHDQRRKLQHGQPRTVPRKWVLLTGAPDPASGTLLPLLCPPVWTSSWKKPTARKAMHALETACYAVDRNLSYSRSNHTSAAAAALPAPADAIGPPHPATITTPVPVSNAGVWRPRRPTLSRDELLSFVDPPPEGDTIDEHMEFIRDPYLRRYAQADEPQVVVAHSRKDADDPTWRDVAQCDSEEQKLLRELDMTVAACLRNPSKVSAVEVYDTYRQLPGTRMSHVPAILRHKLFRALGMVEKKDAQSMLRYFAVVADVKDCGFSLLRAEWNAAMSFASRYAGAVTTSEVEAAVNLWREMEQKACVQGNGVTFNVLFDVASKAGNFTLAEMVYQEMEKRGLRYNRYHHVSLIHFFGLKLDADGIRAAYQEMVAAGEMIDVVVLNCVISGFLRCGEEDAAERVYMRMHHSYMNRLKSSAKRTTGRQNESNRAAPETADAALSSSHTGPLQPAPHKSFTLPSLDTTNFASQKVMTAILMMLAKVSKGDSNLRAGFQYLMPTRPNLATYRILINHYAVRLGDLPTVTRLLSDMKTLRIPLHGAIFLALFKGFAIHGGRPGTGAIWSDQRLRSIWAALLKALDDEAAGLYISTWLIIWALRAFDQCSTPEMVFKAYNSLMSRWDPSETDADFTIGVLHSLLKKWRPPSPSEIHDDSDKSNGGVGNQDQAGSRASRGSRSVLGQLGGRGFG